MLSLAPRSNFVRRSFGAAALVSVVLATGGCATPPTRITTRAEQHRLASSGSAGPLAPPAVRRAALLFARSYVVSRNHPRHPVTAGASATLAAQLRVNSRYLAEHPPARPVRLLGVAIEEDRAARVVATVLFSVSPSNRPLGVAFVLRHSRSRWLAVAIRGNAA